MQPGLEPGKPLPQRRDIENAPAQLVTVPPEGPPDAPVVEGALLALDHAAGHVAPGLGSDRDLAIEAMNDVLGGTFTARVNMNLREEKGWAYGARTILQSASGPRPFLVYAPVQTDRTGDSQAALIRELETIKASRPIESNEMARVVAGSTRELPGQFETARAVLNSLITSARYGRPLDYAASLTERYEALELTDLQAAAGEIVQPDSLIWVVVGDLSTIRAQVEAVGAAPIEIWNDNGESVE